MIIKEKTREYLNIILADLEAIEKEDLRAMASLGVIHVLQEYINELLTTKNMYKDNLDGNQ